MESLADRLNVCQEKILELYEADRKDLPAHIEHWKHVRLECALYYKARECGLRHLNHQVVPALVVSRAKGHEAIEMHMALESLNKSDYNNEDWTLTETSLERWRVPPTGCFKKQGRTVEVRYDCEKENAMHYTLWSYIYVWGDNGWMKVSGNVDSKGLYYCLEGVQMYYVEFHCDAQKYGKTNTWEVHVGGTVIHFPDSISSSAISSTVPTVEIAAGLQRSPKASSAATLLCNTDGWKSPPAKKPRGQDTTDADPVRALDSNCNPLLCGTVSNAGGHHNHCEAVPIVHLKGDPNGLKCLRYRLGKHKNLYQNISSTWHWTDNTENKKAIVTITYKSELQRQQFLNTVKIPATVTISAGVMSL
ncbi:E2 [Macaca fascicularis papillomavirus 7]|uniref:Regulatory protein E2 n=1 Tax=Macaca fascicularis papillomavirus 7 TaxID=471185 RepID=C3PU67_RHPV1|nr:E2 [Macaca fascicularis papillomavirus 7]